ncbi:hypothetical protein SAMN05518672_104434 [Chitinophaga sp. CF118]|uniref:hypothetical protein n=1 Tax=Chitinophaga sp. CF118 TaxID=1884367 RepID=UPI0008EB9025|nr:hypothetical protein [Chitinophaga sp. CF118]SFE08916.1 hypothetical protein SAMN05518672_104434 [Chitinophaga sp. CF118]
MMKFLVIIALLSVFQPDVEGVYTRHKQLCSVIDAFDKKWELTLRHDSSFIYIIHELYTRNSLDSTYNARGTWAIAHDTLTLKTSTSSYLFQFVVKDKMLIPIREKEVNRGGFVMKLDCLTRM